MAILNRRPDEKETTASLAEQVKEQTKEEPITVETKEVQWGDVKIVSTGSTLLDLAISGGRIYEGGIPCCILCEIYGPAGSGKTAILSEVGASAQIQNGDIIYMDPEARLDEEYSRIYGISLTKKNYHRPSTVSEVFDLLKGWEAETKGPKVALTDSLAALTTDLELETGDKMGMRRAKEFSSGLRVNARLISTLLFLCSNQEREGDNGIVTPGGKAIPYYSSLRIRIRQKSKIEVEKKLENGVKVSKVIGINSECSITKSTVDDPYRTVVIPIVFGYGVDSIRENLQYVKDMKKTTSYGCPNGKSFMGMEQAIRNVEENNLVADLKKETITIWHEVENLFKANRERRKIR